jgi:predicted GNAT superfamily acetyltransferase
MVAPADDERITYLRRLCDRFDVIEVDGRVAGLVVTFRPGTSYDSANYRWFSERLGDDFYYLDRVVVDASVRRRGVAGQVYDELEAVAAGYGRMALEVNLVPRNDGSLAFHAQRGYVEIGQLGDDDHLVSLLTKQLP